MAVADAEFSILVEVSDGNRGTACLRIDTPEMYPASCVALRLLRSFKGSSVAEWDVLTSFAQTDAL